MDYYFIIINFAIRNINFDILYYILFVSFMKIFVHNNNNFTRVIYKILLLYINKSIYII